MASRFYFHDALTGVSDVEIEFRTLNLAAPDVAWTGARGSSTLRTMTATIGTSQASISGTTLGQMAAQNHGIRRWCSPLLAAQTLTAAGATITLNVAGKVTADLLAGGDTPGSLMGLFVVTPGNSGWNTAIFSTTFTGNEPTVQNQEQVSQIVVGFGGDRTVLDGDVLIFELMAQITQPDNGTRTVTAYYDGTTVNTTPNAVVSNHASFLEFSQTLILQGGGGGATVRGFRSLLGVGR